MPELLVYQITLLRACLINFVNNARNNSTLQPCNWLMSGNALQETDAGIIRTY